MFCNDSFVGDIMVSTKRNIKKGYVCAKTVLEKLYKPLLREIVQTQAALPEISPGSDHNTRYMSLL